MVAPWRATRNRPVRPGNLARSSPGNHRSGRRDLHMGHDSLYCPTSAPTRRTPESKSRTYKYFRSLRLPSATLGWPPACTYDGSRRLKLIRLFVAALTMGGVSDARYSASSSSAVPSSSHALQLPPYTRRCPPPRAQPWTQRPAAVAAYNSARGRRHCMCPELPFVTPGRQRTGSNGMAPHRSRLSWGHTRAARPDLRSP